MANLQRFGPGVSVSGDPGADCEVAAPCVPGSLSDLDATCDLGLIDDLHESIASSSRATWLDLRAV